MCHTMPVLSTDLWQVVAAAAGYIIAITHVPVKLSYQKYCTAAVVH